VEEDVLVKYSLYGVQNIVFYYNNCNFLNKIFNINLLKMSILNRTLNIPIEAQKLAEKHDFEIQAYKFGTVFKEQLRTPR
jgi:hypothetical protein